MEDLFGEINCRSRSDSIVMRLLRSAMDEAHEKVQSQNGPIEFLHERSKFYELAAILVDSGLNIVEEEADIQETSRQKMLSDLTEIKDWLQRRIEEMRNSIIEKDKELMERVENELKLRRALELNERELVYLREKLERTQSEDLTNFIRSSQEIQDEAQGGDICELKNSVDQQVSSIKQKLEDERKSLISTRRMRGRSSRSSDSELFSKLFDEDRQSGSGSIEDKIFGDNHFSGIKSQKNLFNPGKNNIMIQQMSSDIDILKETLDLAFGRMQTAEMFPLEKQWRWSIEKDTIVVSVKGFINGIQQIFRPEFEKSGDCIPSGFSSKKWSELINDVRDLHDELNSLCSQGKVEEKISNMHELSVPPASVQRTNSEPIPEVFSKVLEKDSDPSGSHYVAKMVKNHESFIQKQREREEWNWLAREIFQRKGSSSVKRDKDPDELETRIQKAIKKLNNLIRWDDNIGIDKGFCDNESILEASITKIDGAATERINDGNGADLSNAIRELKQERDELKLQILIIEEVYLLLFGGFAKSLNLKLFKDDNENLIISDSHGLSMNDAEDGHGVATYNLHNEKSGKLEKEFLQHYLKSSIREDVLAVYFQETVLEWNNNMESNADDYLVKEEIWRIVFGESMQCIAHSGNMIISRLQMDIEGFETPLVNLPCSSMLPETIGGLLKEDVYIVYLRELLNAWRTEIDACYMEILIKEDIYQFVMIELMKESYVTTGQFKTSEQMKFSKDFPSPAMLGYLEEKNLIEKPDSCFEQWKEEEIKSTSSQTKEQSEQCHEVAEDDSIKLLSNDDVRTSSKVSEKLEISFDRLLKNKALVYDMQDNSSRTLEDKKEDDYQAQVHLAEEVESERQHTYCQPEENEVLQQNSSVLSLLMGFHEVLVDFQHMVHKKLEFNYLRYLTLLLKVSTRIIVLNSFLLAFWCFQS